jgi:N-acetylmuramoyl-L-alanine amidase
MPQKICRITNLWSQCNWQKNETVSRVIIESTQLFPYQIDYLNQKKVVFNILSARANMAPQTIEVSDGLIDKIIIQQLVNDVVSVDIYLNYPMPGKISFRPGVPTKTILSFDRLFIQHLFQNKIIALDPGHGGNDYGGRGPVSLIEKDVVFTMTKKLQDLLEQNKAQVLLTRETDQNVPLAHRFLLAKKFTANVFISFHVYHSNNPKVSGLALKYNPQAENNFYLAQYVYTELARKIKRPLRGIKVDPQLCYLENIPGIMVEPVVISNWTEEGLLRNPTFYEKIAFGVFNGLRKYFPP